MAHHLLLLRSFLTNLQEVALGAASMEDRDLDFVASRIMEVVTVGETSLAVQAQRRGVSSPLRDAAPAPPRPLHRRLRPPPPRLLRGRVAPSLGHDRELRGGKPAAAAPSRVPPDRRAPVRLPPHHPRPPRLHAARPDPVTGELSVAFGGFVKAASGDGLLLLTFLELIGTVASATDAAHGGAPELELTDLSMNPDITRFVCNPLSGELFRLPDIDGTKKTMWFSDIGILTQSERPDGPPDRYAIAVLGHDGTGISFGMRRFLLETGKWDKLGLHSPLPLSRRMDMDIPHEAVAFAGRLWWFDVTWGALSLDPFSDQPELRFVELPRGSVIEPVDKEGRRELVKYRAHGGQRGEAALR
ncbi:hypothetical protein PR202_gb01517 [Eleusine coracana subsp. coracana]|uniref:Uncharacterized protein n=1 Tax=Eleusine coracana subsp. coracana TaxID=191504 RepID=A0AAV5DWG4_ELECO|nr:hypothetical protein PR202_gb01517 [Eleusine coracana subsp. coracana]